MLSFSGSLKVLVALEACDMRKGFNGLHALAAERLAVAPHSFPKNPRLNIRRREPSSRSVWSCGSLLPLFGRLSIFHIQKRRQAGAVQTLREIQSRQSPVACLT